MGCPSTCALEQPAHDLTAARLGQIFHKIDDGGYSDWADLMADVLLQVADQTVVSLDAGIENVVGVDDVAP